MALFGFILVAVGGWGADGSGKSVVARVGERDITFDDLQIVALQNGYDLNKKSDHALALRDAVNQEVLAAEARKRGLENDPEIQRWVRSQIVQRLLRETVDAKEPPKPTEAELRDYYEKHRAEFTPPTVAQAQILALLRRAGDEPAFTKRVEEVQAAIASGKLSFGQAVQHYSDDPAAKTQSGITNWLVKGEPNPLFPATVIDTVFGAADTKTVAGPIAFKDWVYFVRLHERRDGKPMPFEQARETIARTLARQKRMEAYNAFVQGLTQSVPVQTWPEKVAELTAAQAKPSGPPAGPVRPRP